MAGGGAVGVLFDDAPGPTALRDPVGAGSRLGDHPAKARTLDQGGSRPAVVARRAGSRELVKTAILPATLPRRRPVA